LDLTTKVRGNEPSHCLRGTWRAENFGLYVAEELASSTESGRQASTVCGENFFDVQEAAEHVVVRVVFSV